MTCDLKFDVVMEELEQKELETKDIEAADYENLLAIYLANNDTFNAKFLWKRIPQTIKDSSDSLKAIWDIGKSLIQGDYAAIYSQIDSKTWPSHLTSIMSHLRKEQQSRIIQLISKGYTAISLSDAMLMTGCTTEEEIIKLGESAGWKIDAPFGFIISKKVLHDEENVFSSNQEQLEKLTDYVSFLENHY